MCFESPHPSNFTQNVNACVCSKKRFVQFVYSLYFSSQNNCRPLFDLIWKYTCVLYKDMTEQTAFSCVCTKKFNTVLYPCSYLKLYFFFTFILPVVPTIACSKVELLGQLLHPRQLVNASVRCIMGMIVAWCCAITIGSRYDTLSYMCPQSDG